MGSKQPQPSVSIDTDTNAVYVKIADFEHSHATQELLPGVLFADLDENGRLLGVEILAPPPPPKRVCPHCKMELP